MGFQGSNLLLATVNFEPCYLAWKPCLLTANCQRHGGSIVDNTLECQPRDRNIDSRFSGLSDETLTLLHSERPKLIYSLLTRDTVIQSEFAFSTLVVRRHRDLCTMFKILECVLAIKIHVPHAYRQTTRERIISIISY